MPFPRIVPPTATLLDLQVVGGVITDVSDYAHAVTTNNGVTTTTDVDLGSVMVFSGPGSTYLRLPTLSIGSDYEFEIWFKATTFHNSYSGAGNFLFVVAPSTAGVNYQQLACVCRRASATTAYLEFWHSNGTLSSGIDAGEGPLLSTNIAYHVKVRISTISMSMWLDDVLQTTQPCVALEETSGRNSVSDIRLHIGADWDGGTTFNEFLSGYISRLVVRRFPRGNPP